MEKTGKIKSVYCKNFVTYNECLFHPSEYLNVIIGPNGTGKSTLVSAIVLGLGGDPKILARSSSIADYVKNGCESSKVIVEVYGHDDDDTIQFQREFDSNGKSQFAINSESVTQKKFLQCVNQFKIQIGNLCQFLPQDRVQDFAKMNPQEILSNTLNSVCDTDVIDSFKKLKELQSNQENAKSKYKDLGQKLAETKHRVEELKVLLECYMARKDVQEKLNVCMAKKLRLEFEELEVKIAEHENDLELAKENVKTFEREYETVVKKQTMIDNTTDKIKKEIEEKDRNLKIAEDKKNKIVNQIELIKNRINEEKAKFEKRKRDANERQNELKHEIKMLEVYAQDLKNLNRGEMSEANSEQRVRECEVKMEQIKQEAKRLNQEHRKIQNKLDECIPEKQNLKSRLESLENVNEQKLKFLKLKFPDVYEGIKWMDENMDKFEGRVYKPMILELNVRNPNYAKYLENTINLRDMLAFACESTSDLSFITTELYTKRKLLINIFHAPEPDDSIFTPKIPIEDIRQYGFEAYLIDVVKGPRAVLGYLCNLYQLQNIPYGGENVNSCTDRIPHEIRNYFGGDLRYALLISRYGNRGTSLMQTSISSKGLLTSTDETQIQAIRQRLNQLTYSSDELRNQRTQLEVQIREKEVLCMEQSRIRKQILGQKNEIQQKVAQLERQKQKVQSLKEDIIAIPEMEKELKEVCEKSVRDIINLQAQKIEALNSFQNAMDKKVYSRTKLYIFKQENEELINIISTTKEKRDSARNRVELISNKCNSLKRDSKLKLTESLKLTNQIEPTNKKFPHKAFYETLPNNFEELRDKISDYSGHLDCLDDVDPEIVREYDAKTNDVELLKKEIESNIHGHENVQAEIKQIYDSWYPTVCEVVTTINTHFGDFMESMGYVGEVKLVNKSEHDFDSYGIEILVQYRKNMPLQALNRHVQSGGERAVAIAVYTLSMQHITHVPFRCVDEINQGMDARNERKVFEMLVDETTKTGRSQYFFVTPKLLRNLKTNERMTVHVVFNGRMVQSQNAFAVI